MTLVQFVACTFCLMLLVETAPKIMCGAQAAGGSTPGEEGPNGSIALITIDTLRADFLGCYGNPAVHTPTIDRLSRRAVTFTNVVTDVPLTLPAHTTIMTGKSVFEHGVTGNLESRVPDDLETLASFVQARDYQTAAFIGGFPLHHQFGLQRGFMTYDDAFDLVPGQGELAERSGLKTAQAAVAWFRTQRQRQQPYFLWLHLYDPHYPYIAQPVYGEGPSAAYAAEVTAADRAVQRLLTAIAQDAAPSPVVLVAADHGESLGEHGEPTHGIFLYEATMHVPLLCALKPLKPAAAKLSQTFLGLQQIAPAIESWVAAGQYATAIRFMPSNHVRMLTDYPWQIYRWLPVTGVRTSDCKLLAAKQSECYDLERDPAEADPAAVKCEAIREAFKLDPAMPFHHESSVAEPVLSDESREKLASLGYAGSASQPAQSLEGLPDPHERIALLPELDAAVQMVRMGNSRAALPRLEELLRADPQNPVIHNNLGIALLATGEPEKAVIWLQKAIAADLQNARLQNNLGMAYKQTGQVSEAQQHFARAAALDERFLPARFNLGKLLWEAGNFAEGRPHLLAAMADEELKPLVLQLLKQASKDESGADDR